MPPTHPFCLQRDGAEAFILDLRNNPGGLVNVALDVAGLWMDGPAPVFNVMVRVGRRVGAEDVRQAGVQEQACNMAVTVSLAASHPLARVVHAKAQSPSAARAAGGGGG